MGDPSTLMPARFADLKREIAESVPDFEKKVTRAWNEVLVQLKESSKEITKQGSNIVPQFDFSDLQRLSEQDIALIKRRGCVVIRNVVDDSEAIGWEESLREFARANPDAPGIPEDNRQFFMLYWTKAQVHARAHPNVLAASTWLNNLYHTTASVDGVDLNAPLSYADRFRIRKPDTAWDRFPPHVDGGSIERWEDPAFRACYEDILRGEWEKHDPYALQGRLDARRSLYDQPRATIFRTFQGWLAMSETAPGEGTLQVFPDVLLGNAYITLRPFFRPKATPAPADALRPENWEFDISSPEFPGIFPNPNGAGYAGPRPTPDLHPHLRLEQTMTAVPKVYPGDMVFWHGDLIHAVECEHKGPNDSSVMYIGAVPTTPRNTAYITRQREAFLQGAPPPDFPQTGSEAHFVGGGKVDDIVGEAGRRAMGFAV